VIFKGMRKEYRNICIEFIALVGFFTSGLLLVPIGSPGWLGVLIIACTCFSAALLAIDIQTIWAAKWRHQKESLKRKWAALLLFCTFGTVIMLAQALFHIMSADIQLVIALAMLVLLVFLMVRD
jgi:hypothetical protein